MLSEQTKKELIIIYQIFKNNNIEITFKGVKNTPFIKNISCYIKLDSIKNINKLKTIFKTLETLLNNVINWSMNGEQLDITMNQKKYNLLEFEKINFLNIPKNNDFIFLGYDQDNKQIFKSLKNLKSILIGGTSGSGKSNLLHNIILSYLLLNDKNYLFLIDPKYTELNLYSKSILKNRLVMECGHEKKDILNIINAYINIIKDRFKKMNQLKQQTSTEQTCLLIIDEYANLFNTTKEKNIINEKISYIASIGRAARCYLILTTQHPTNANINNTIRSNLQTKIALHCENIQQSQNIIESSEAIKIDRPGQFIIKTDDGIKNKLQAPFVSLKTLNQILKASK